MSEQGKTWRRRRTKNEDGVTAAEKKLCSITWGVAKCACACVCVWWVCAWTYVCARREWQFVGGTQKSNASKKIMKKLALTQMVKAATTTATTTSTTSTITATTQTTWGRGVETHTQVVWLDCILLGGKNTANVLCRKIVSNLFGSRFSPAPAPFNAVVVSTSAPALG